MLREDQVTDLAELIKRPKIGLLHDPGCGKTPIAAVYTEYATINKGSGAVWIQPKSLVGKNKDEIARFTNIPPEDIHIVRGTPAERKKIMEKKGKVWLFNFTNFGTEFSYLAHHHPEFTGWMAIIDEFHMGYAGHKSTRTQNWYVAMRKFWSVVPMSGTIVDGKLSSVYPMLHVCAPLFYGSYEAFIAQHAWRDEYGTIIGWRNHEKLKEVLKAVSIRRTFESIYGNQDQVVQVERVAMAPLQREKYDEFEEMGLLELTDQFLAADTPAVAAIRLRQIMCHPENVKLPIAFDSKGKPTEWKQYNLLGKEVLTGKDERLIVHIEDAIQAEERLVIFASLVPEQERIVNIIKKMGKTVELINGSVSGKERERISNDFISNKVQFVVCSQPTAAVGFNWGFLRWMVFTSLDYKDSNFIQAMRRGIRGVRDTPLLVYVLEYENSIDQRIFTIVERKAYDHHLVDETQKEIHLKVVDRL